MTPENEAYIRKAHGETMTNSDGYLYCKADMEIWPCDTLDVLDALDEARAEIEVLKEQLSEVREMEKIPEPFDPWNPGKTH